MTPFRRSGRTGGDEGLLTQDEIRALQRALLARGYDLGPSGADGVLGSVTSTTSRTRAAIRSFQISEGIASSGQPGFGMLGPRTQAALAQAIPSAGRDYFTRGLELFSIGSYAAAATAFESARQATGNVAYYFNIGRAHEQAGDDAAAVRAYEALLGAGSPGVDEQEVRRRLNEAQARIAAVRALTAGPAPSVAPSVPPATPPSSPAAPASPGVPGAPEAVAPPGAPARTDPRVASGVPGYAWALVGLGVLGVVGAVAAARASARGSRS